MHRGCPLSGSVKPGGQGEVRWALGGRASRTEGGEDGERLAVTPMLAAPLQPGPPALPADAASSPEDEGEKWIGGSGATPAISSLSGKENAF